MFLQRQKVLVAYLYILGKRCSRLHLIKALFLFSRENDKKLYDFHPYLRGPFSELIYLDLRKLDEKKIIKNGEKSLEIVDLESVKGAFKELPSDYVYYLQCIATKYGSFSDSELMDTVYKNFPYFAINNPNRKGEFDSYDPRKKDINLKAKLFTIGYEGISIDEYIDKLISNNISILVDVRKNPQSMKYGFSKSRLEDILQKRHIKYIHIPELGIDGEERKNLNIYSDYLKLFNVYRENLPKKEDYLSIIIKYLEKGERVALTCFEADCNCCHRNEITKYIYPRVSNKYELKHI